MSMQTREQMLLDLERKAYLDAIAQARAEGERAGKIAMREEAVGLFASIEPDAELAGCDPTWGDFVQLAQAAIRALKVEGE